MNGFWLKVIALLSMTIDHIGFHLLPEGSLAYLLCRAVGRIALPLYCYLIAEGYRYTKNRMRYFLRLGGFACLIECALFLLYWYSGINYLLRVNIFLTLSVSLACLILLKSGELIWRLAGIAILIGTCILPFDYGVYAVLLVLLFGFTERFSVQSFGLFALNLLFINLMPLSESPILVPFTPLQWCSMFALAGILAYNGTEGRRMKSFFYWYYPLHLLVILGLKALLIG